MLPGPGYLAFLYLVMWPAFDLASWLTCIALVALFLLASLGLLCSLRQTLARCRVRSVQILRVVAYAAAPVLLLWGLYVNLVVLSDVLLWWMAYLAEINDALEAAVGIGVGTVPIAMFAWFLAAGLRYYLRLPRARLVALVCMFVAALFTVTVFAVLAVWF